MDSAVVHHGYNFGQAGVAVNFSRVRLAGAAAELAAAPEPVANRSPRAVARRGHLGSREPACEEQRCARGERHHCVAAAVAHDGATHVPRRGDGAVAVRPARQRHANAATAAVAGRERAERRAPVPRRVFGDARGRLQDAQARAAVARCVENQLRRATRLGSMPWDSLVYSRTAAVPRIGWCVWTGT